MNKTKTFFLAALMAPTLLHAQSASQGWPAAYGGVMLQGFYWDSFKQSQWTKLEKQTADFKGYFDLVWVPQSGKPTGSPSMGYDPLYYYNQNSSFGTESELRSMIKTFKDAGIGTIADVVVNHRGNYSNWVDFPAETYNGTTYQMLSTDIVKNDDNGRAATEAAALGLAVSANNDEGEDWVGMRDLDHKSENVQQNVKAYVKYLVNDLGYTGFRYDMVKGFGASHVGDYNDEAGVSFSVGEYWDSSSRISNWIDATSNRSAAFDFQFKYTVRNAVDRKDWSYLGKQNDSSYPLVSNSYNNGKYRRYAVTFVENHDTEVRPDGSSNGPLQADTLAANAYMLAMPGTPCVFYKHYLAYPTEIKAMIDARKAAGINNETTVTQMRSNANYYAFRANGTHQLMAVVGSDLESYVPSSASYTEVLAGYHYKYYLANTAETAFASMPSGQYAEAFQTKLTAVSATSGAQLVYTIDGSEPTASNGTVVESGAEVSIAATCTLKVGLLVNGQVTTVIERNYTFVDPEAPEEVTFETPAEGYTFTAYFVAPSTWDSDTRCYAWVWTDTQNYTGGNWPGDREHVYRIGQTAEGLYIWQWCYYGTLTETPTGIIFNNGASGVGTNQTKDMVFTNGGSYDMNTTVSDPTLGISGVVVDNGTAKTDSWYTLQGVRISKPTQKGIYINGGRKVMVK